MTNDKIYALLTDKLEKTFSDRPNVLNDINIVLRDVLFGKNDTIYRYRSIDELIDSVLQVTLISKDKLLSKNRSRELVAVRQFIAYKAKEIFGVRYSLKEIGNKLGHKEHSNVLHSIKQCKDRLDAKDGVLCSILSIWERYTEKKFSE